MAKNSKLNPTNLIIVFSAICIVVVSVLIATSIVNKQDNPSTSNTSTSSSNSSTSQSSSTIQSSSQSVSNPSAPNKTPIPVIVPNGNN